MAKELSDGKFDIRVNPENINQKFPTVSARMNVNGQEFQLPVWIYKGKYGYTASGNTGELISFLRACMGAGIKPPSQDGQNKKDEPSALKPKEENDDSFIR